jgi:uncharacterized membrane protein
MNASFEPPASQVDSAPGTEPPQSGLGIASLVLAILAIVITTAVFAYAGYVEMSAEGGVGADNAVAVVIGLGVFGCIALLVVSAILGVVSVFQKNRRRALGAIGASLSTTMIVLVALLMWVGASQG